ncbi:ATP-binding protein [Streptomyces luomodiensis]|uniref:ATP-binding protein n=1 Tax=Streptomyces luomodiensis TaxID=3026192 RepID=A0ABY9V5M8_9ACTN|nr:ATP-binding protein [Streptomyces sp. SCA4-21]WNF00188.1 ATP-binding protein [Streptomyces sp. SCA4-21]
MASLALPPAPPRTPREQDTHPACALRLPATASSVGTVRAAVRERLLAWGVGSQMCDDALLVVSELVTNVIAHTASDRLECRLGGGAGLLRIEVEDQARAHTLPAPRTPGPDEHGGRGLLLVGAVSSAWGVRDAPHGRGRIVWAELASRTEERR